MDVDRINADWAARRQGMRNGDDLPGRGPWGPAQALIDAILGRGPRPAFAGARAGGGARGGRPLFDEGGGVFSKKGGNVLEARATGTGGGGTGGGRVPTPTNPRGGFQPSDFDLTSIADNPNQARAFQQALKERAAEPGDNAFKDYLAAREPGKTPTQKQCEDAWKSVRSKYKTLAEKEGIDMNGVEIHHWNFNKGDYPDQVFDPRNLFHTPDRNTSWNSHTAVHRATTSDPNTAIGIWKGPIDDIHVLPVDTSISPLAPPAPPPVP